MKKIVFFALAFISTPSLAYDLNSVLQEQPKYEFRGSRPFFEAERCIILSDMPDRAYVYRTPDRPNESLIYYSAGGVGKMVIKLETDGHNVTARLWNPMGKGMIRNVEDCIR